MARAAAASQRFTRHEYRLLTFVSRLSGAFAEKIEEIMTRGFMTEEEHYSFSVIQEMNTVDRFGKSINDRRAA